jgi:hypothetical protein
MSQASRLIELLRQIGAKIGWIFRRKNFSEAAPL